MATSTAKPVLPPLKTPVSATYPSELCSPSLLKRDDGEKTPITPPPAYVDFLALMSPAPTSTSASFSFADKPDSPATSQPSSRASSCSKPDPAPVSAPVSAPAPSSARSDMRVTVPPPSPFPRPLSARTPRLRIPQSPFSAGLRSPMSAHSLHSPYSAALSPGVWSLDGKARDGSSTRAVSVRQVVTRTVTYSRSPLEASNVAQLDPAPKGKRRRIK
ncbi:uncharacterized protein K452DRAFT_298355 [Aplosporella prunicola CBS 121167]|uniref:Uncharacterized protein n=1 Tax=Aplosporella prunicola CBS 121167 TaxID=1176127 RepID=A0A6A6BE77_9PEZI|nr:uncharacterized protein K452DRAFT_298355 [Aplosporella prunicola CBS 121167]KAF2141683.1 hypothetical protein K452DRAFT_298355 [Aplosporella prunicola CBS 121167]